MRAHEGPDQPRSLASDRQRVLVDFAPDRVLVDLAPDRQRALVGAGELPKVDGECPSHSRGRILTRRPLAALLGGVFLLGGACLEVPHVPEADTLHPKDMKAPEGATLETACTPSGVEICFNARDDNCNGVIDEGCGLHTGILQFAVAWEAAEADVDLNVTDPTGELARKNGETTAGGLTKDRDCPSECHGQNVENVYLAEGEDPRRGKYRVVVRLDKPNGATLPVRVRLGARVGQKSYGMVVDLAAGNDEKTFEFTL